MRMAILFLGVVSLVGVLDVQAKLNCKDPVSNQDMIQCARLDYAAADKDLNAIFPKVMDVFKELYSPDMIASANGQDPVADLKDAQRKWIAFRDANCRLVGAEMLGGSGQPLLETGCLARMTKERVKELRGFVEE